MAGMMDDEVINVSENVDDTAAFNMLETAFVMGKISEERFNVLKDKLSAMHAVLLATVTNTQVLNERATSLDNKAAAGSKKFGELEIKQGVIEDQADQLRDDLEQAETAMVKEQEREVALEIEVNVLMSQKEDLEVAHAEMQREYELSLQPVIARLGLSIDSIKEEKEKLEKDTAVTKFEVESLVEEHAQREEVVQSTLAAIKVVEEQLVVEKMRPDGVRKQINQLDDDRKSQLRALEQANMKLKELDKALDQINASHKASMVRYEQDSLVLERSRMGIEQKEEANLEINIELEKARQEQEILVMDSATTKLKKEHILVALRDAQEAHTKQIRNKNSALLALKKADAGVQALRELVPGVNREIYSTQLDKMLEERVVKKLGKEVMEVKREVDVGLFGVIKEEKLTEAVTQEQKLAYETAVELEEKLKVEKVENARLMQETKALQYAREETAKNLRAMKEKVRQAHHTLVMLDLDKEALRVRRKEVKREHKEYKALYEMVKQQRNKFESMIISAKQAILEIKEKYKIVSNEVEVLRRDAESKGVALLKVGRMVIQSNHDRVKLRASLDELVVEFRKRQYTIDENITTMDRLNALINSAERNLLQSRKSFEFGMEQRNFAGIQLIDRNDELCILYEKSHIQEEVAKQGTIAILQREDEIRLLKLEVTELQRAIFATRKLLPLLPALDDDISKLQVQVEAERAESARLSAALEDPNHPRRRDLGGKSLEVDDLVAKVVQLEERLQDKKEQLLEKSLILEEVTGLSDRMVKVVGETREGALETALKANSLQARVRKITRTMMSTVSELSMYQASAMQLKEERDYLEIRVDQAKDAGEAGLPPTEDSEAEFVRMMRDENVRAELDAKMRTQREQFVESLGLGGMAPSKSSAPARPNAYIPEGHGTSIPKGQEDILPFPEAKPYGRFAPLKPSQTGSTMRHIRKPVPQPIVL